MADAPQMSVAMAAQLAGFDEARLITMLQAMTGQTDVTGNSVFSQAEMLSYIQQMRNHDQQAQTNAPEPQQTPTEQQAVDNAVTIESLNLPTRFETALKEAGFSTLADLAGTSRDDLLQIKGVGPKAADTIQAQMESVTATEAPAQPNTGAEPTAEGADTPEPSEAPQEPAVGTSAGPAQVTTETVEEPTATSTEPQSDNPSESAQDQPETGAEPEQTQPETGANAQPDYTREPGQTQPETGAALAQSQPVPSEAPAQNSSSASAEPAQSQPTNSQSQPAPKLGFSSEQTPYPGHPQIQIRNGALPLMANNPITWVAPVTDLDQVRANYGGAPDQKLLNYDTDLDAEKYSQIREANKSDGGQRRVDLTSLTSAWMPLRNAMLKDMMAQMRQERRPIEMRTRLAPGMDLVMAETVANMAEHLRSNGKAYAHLVVMEPVEYSADPEVAAVQRRILAKADAIVTYQEAPTDPQNEQARTDAAIKNADLARQAMLTNVERVNGLVGPGVDSLEAAAKDNAQVREMLAMIDANRATDARPVQTHVYDTSKLVASREHQVQVTKPRVIDLQLRQRDGVEPNPSNWRDPAQRTEYVMLPQREHHVYESQIMYADSDMDPRMMPYLHAKLQDRYPWRSPYVQESSPVTKAELMKAFGPALATKKAGKDLERLLSVSQGTTAKVDGAELVSTIDSQGLIYDMSPSDVQTSVTVLRALHDAQIDYDLEVNRDHQLVAHVAGNSGARVVVLDLKEPQRVGGVSTRNGTFYGPELGRLLYQDANDPHSQTYALFQDAVSENQNGRTVDVLRDPIVTSTNSKTGAEIKNFRHSDRRVNQTTVYDQRREMTTGRYGRPQPHNVRVANPEATQRSRDLARARYTGLDQKTKNMLALSSMMSALAIDPQRLPEDLQAQLPDAAKNAEQATYQTTSRIGNAHYRAQINWGTDHDATIGKVQVMGLQSAVDPETHQPILQNFQAAFEDPLFHNGPIKMDLQSTSVVDNIYGGQSNRGADRKNLYAPNVITDAQATYQLVDAFQRARINYLSELTGEDQTNVDETIGADQKRLRNILQNPTPNLAPLTGEQQHAVLDLFRDGLQGAQMPSPNVTDIDEIRVNDQALRQNRQELLRHAPNQVTATRMQMVYDQLTDLFNQRFGTAALKTPDGQPAKLPSADKLAATQAEYQQAMQMSLRLRPEAEQTAGKQALAQALDRVNHLYQKTPGYQDGDAQTQQKFADTWLDQPISEQHRLLRTLDPSGKAAQEFRETLNQLSQQYPPKPGFNLTNIAEAAQLTDGRGADFQFQLAQDLGQSPFKDNLVGNNDADLATIMERAVHFDPKTAMTREQLLAQDQTGAEAELQQYLADVKAGRKQFSFDPNENPDPGAFTADGTALINPESANHFKARAMDVVEQRLKARGVQVNPDDITMDQHGIIHFKAQVPLYNAVDHQAMTSGADWQRTPAGDLQHSDVAYSNASSERNPRFQPIEGSIGQVFAPGHDGLIRTNYNRFDTVDPNLNQLVFASRARAGFDLLPIDANGRTDFSKLDEEAKSGLGANERMRIATYDSIFNRTLGQSVDDLLDTSAVSDVTRNNSTTVLSKLLHGGVLGGKAPAHLVEQAPSAERQANLETLQYSTVMDDASSQTMTTSSIITFGQKYQQTVDEMQTVAQEDVLGLQALIHSTKNQIQTQQHGQPTPAQKLRLTTAQSQLAELRAQLRNPQWPDKMAVLNEMQSPVAQYNMHIQGEMAHECDSFYFSDSTTGQGYNQGRTRYRGRGVEVDPQTGKVTPNVFKNADGSYMRDENGRVVGQQVYTPEELLAFHNESYKNAFDRQFIAKEQHLKAHGTVEGVGIANMAIAGYTTEDAMVVSKAFAEAHMITDSNGVKRPLRIGDKISDVGGNKATIALVVDPEMSPEAAEKENLLDVVNLFKENPDLDVVMNGMSQMSRNNGATTYNMLANPSSAPMTFTKQRRDANGNFVDQGQVQTNATINVGKLIITDQTVDKHVTLYEDADNDGRKGGGLNLNSDAAKDAPAVANYFRNYRNGILDWRRHLLSMGYDMTPAGQPIVSDYAALIEAGQATVTNYQLSDQDQALLNKKVLDKDGNPSLYNFAQGPDGRPQALLKTDGHTAPIFNGLTPKGELTPDSVTFIKAAVRRQRSQQRSAIASITDLSGKTYNARRDFLSQLPDGGLLQLPEGLTVTLPGGPSDKLYILPRSMRRDTQQINGTTVQSDYNRIYGDLGEKLAHYQQMMTALKPLANGDAQALKAIQHQVAESLNIQQSIQQITQTSSDLAFGKGNAKNSEFNKSVLAGRMRDSVTTQVSSNPNLPLDTIELSPAIAKKLGFVTDPATGFAHMEGHPDWDHLHVHRDPIWREQGSLGFRVKINDGIDSTRISPIVASLMDADFDGDTLGLVAMKGNQVQQELKEKMSVDQWLLDNNTTNSFSKASNLLNINAELVDMASTTHQRYHLPMADGTQITVEPFNHRRQENGRQVPVKDDPALVQSWIETMHHLRPDVLPQGVFDKQGQFNPDNAKALILAGKVNDGEMLNMMVNHTIKTYYEPGRDTNGFVKADAARQARAAVDEIIQTARGLDKQIDPQTGLTVYREGANSSFDQDGVNYTDETTLRESLMHYVTEGAKGKPSAVDSLFTYMNKPTVTELVALGQKQLNADGTLNAEAVRDYQKKLEDVHKTMLGVQRATKEKTDLTGVPGNIQKMLTNVMATDRYHESGLHVANAIGQEATQKILSIKRDPIGAAQAGELLQGPIEKLLEGQRPTQYPVFMLMGSDKDGHLGSDIIDVASRLTILKNAPISNADGHPASLFRNNEPLKKGHRGSFSDQDMLALAKNTLGLDPQVDEKDSQAVSDYADSLRQTLLEATSPIVPNDYVDAQGKKHVIFEHDAKKSQGSGSRLTRREFVNAMDYLYNEKLGVNVDRANFELLADAISENPAVDGHETSMEERQAKAHEAVNQRAEDLVFSTKNATIAESEKRNDKEQVGQAPLMAKIKQDGMPVFEEVAMNQAAGIEIKQDSQNLIFAPEDSWVRKFMFGGQTDAELAQAMNLNTKDNPYNHERAAEVTKAAEPALVVAQAVSQTAETPAKTDQQVMYDTQTDILNDVHAAIVTTTNEQTAVSDGQLTVDEAQNALQDSYRSAQEYAQSTMPTAKARTRQRRETMQDQPTSQAMPQGSAKARPASQPTVASQTSPTQANAVPASKRSQVAASSAKTGSQSAPISQPAQSVPTDAPQGNATPSQTTTAQTRPDSRQDFSQASFKELGQASKRQQRFVEPTEHRQFDTAQQFLAFKYYQMATARDGVQFKASETQQIEQQLHGDGAAVKAAIGLVQKAHQEQLGTPIMNNAETMKYLRQGLQLQQEQAQPATAPTQPKSQPQAKGQSIFDDFAF